VPEGSLEKQPDAISANEADDTKEKLSRRAAQRARRIAIFHEWDEGTTFVEVGKRLGLAPRRVRQIVLKAVIDDGCRSNRARAWMAHIDKEGYWLSRYDADFRRGPKLRAGSSRKAQPGN
jgi:hypothetical protein